MKLIGADEKLLKDSGENIFIGQSDPALQKTSKQLFVMHPLQGANITQIFLLTKTTETHAIQLVPNI